MGKDKIRRFEAVKTFDNFIEPILKEDCVFKGKWRKQFFKNNHPIVLELGCGKGEYSIGMANYYPKKNFIGIDIKGARMFVGAKQAIDQKMKNIAFLRTKIDFIEDCFEENEVDEIWLTFSDPQPKKKNKRLTSSVFINRYKKILKKGGVIHLKTDSDLLFAYTEEQIKSVPYKCLSLTWDLYGDYINEINGVKSEILKIKTHYEKLFTLKGAKIKYCKFQIS